jgi:hypothetical protein
MPDLGEEYAGKFSLHPTCSEAGEVAACAVEQTSASPVFAPLSH